jgi:hypothetical protein
MDGYSVGIIGVDTLPLPLKKDFPEKVWVEDPNGQGRLVSFKNQYARSTGLGNRVWNIAKQLSANGLKVTVLIPKHRLPPTCEFIDMEKIPFAIEVYDSSKTTFQYSDDFQKQLSQFTTVIVQPGGIALWNCIYLPSNIQLILDGYIPILSEQPNWLTTAATGYQENTRQFVYDRFIDIHTKLMKRIDAVIYANENQACYYEGQLLLLGRVNLNVSQIAIPMIKLPMGVDSVNVIKKKKEKDGTLRLLWYGGAYPWFDPEYILDTLGNQPNIFVDFCGLKHPRFVSSDVCADSAESKIAGYDNMKVLEMDYIEDPSELFSQYDAGIVMAKETPEQHYAHRSRILEMVRYGLPVITDEVCDFANEFCLQNVYTIPRSTFLNDMNTLSKSGLSFDNADIKTIKDSLTWPATTKMLINYLKAQRS